MQGPGFCKPPPRSLQLQDGGAAQWLEYSIFLSAGLCGLHSRAGLRPACAAVEWDTQAWRAWMCTEDGWLLVSSPGAQMSSDP